MKTSPTVPVKDDTTFTNARGEIVKITSVQSGIAFEAVDNNGQQIYHVVKIMVQINVFKIF